MNHRLWLPLLAAVWLALPAGAQTIRMDDANATKRSQSHVPIPSSVGDAEQAQQFLATRLRRAQDLSGLQKLLQDPEIKKLAEDVLKDPDKFGLKDQVERLKKNPPPRDGDGRPDLNDPKWRELVSRALEQQKKDGSLPALSPDKIEQWKKLLPPDMMPRQPGDPAQPMPDPRMPPDPTPPTPPMPPTPPDATPPQPTPPVTPPAVTPPKPAEPDPAVQESRARFNQGLVDFAEKMAGRNGALKDSPALQQFVRDMGRAFTNESKRGLGLTEKTGGLGEKLEPWGRSLGLDKVGAGMKDRSWLPALPSVHWSGNGPSWQGPKGWNAPRLGAPDVGGADTWSAVLWLVTILVLVAVVAAALLWHRHHAARAAEGGWRLGPWPVNPRAVATRDELVRAFEYLSLLLLGPAARTRHHLDIAARLSDKAASLERSRAAEGLAALYEQARYAPPHEALPAAELAAARRDLCLLAGVPAA